MDKKTKGKIIATLRRLTYSYPPRNNVRKRAKIGPCAFQCELCERKVYDGAKDISKVDIEGIEKGKVVIDHTNPVVPVEGFPDKEWDWNIFIDRMFCEEDGLQLVCTHCHDIKTKEENKQRRKK